MRYLFALFLSVLILAGCQRSDSSGYRIDPQATAQAQWKPGEVVAEGEVYWLGIGKPNFYRKFIGITDKGYAVVQDFYAESGKKLTDPYVVMQPDQIGDIRLVKKEVDKSSSALLDGELALWYENGQKKIEGRFQDGKEQGLWTWWFENGKKESEGHFQDGKEQGLWTYWDWNGQKAAEGNYQDGLKQGVWISWGKYGQKLSEGNYQDGNRQGLWIYRDENGKTISETLYEAGNIVSDTYF